MEDFEHPINQVDGLGVQEELELSDNYSNSKENTTPTPTNHPYDHQIDQRIQAELQELRQAQTLARQQALHYRQRAEEALDGFKLAQSRFRQMERARDRQALAAERSKAEKAEIEQEAIQSRQRIHQLESFLDQQAEQLVQTRREAREGQNLAAQYNALAARYNALQGYVQWLEQDRQILQQNLARFEQDLRALQATRTVRAVSKVGKLARGPFQLLKSTARGPLEGGLDLPMPESSIEGTLRLAGWAYSTASRIDKVLVRLDDKLVGKAEYGSPRSDVVEMRPWQLVLNCGFEANLEINRDLFVAGFYTLSVEVWDLSGNHHSYSRPITIKQPHLTP